MNTHNHWIKKELEEAVSILQAFLADEGNIQNISEAISMLSSSLQDGGKILSFGNGGSMSDAMHFAEELTGKYREDRPAYPAIALSDASALTCIGNDFGFENVFARQVEALGKDFDILLAISTSGNSPNILKAVEAAKKKDMIVIAMTGRDGGKLGEACDHEIRIPWDGFSDRIQEMHIMCIHAIISGVESQLKAKGL